MNYSLIKRILLNNKLLLSNYAYVSILNAFSLVIPLITYPYLISRLEEELYGRIVFSFTIIGYIEMIACWGFDISAVKDIAQSQTDKRRINEIVSTVTYTRLFLCVLLIIILFCVLEIINLADKNLYLYFCIYLVSSVTFPGWYFQGIQQLKYITYFQLICKILFLFLIVIFIKEKDDYLYYPILYGCSNVIASLFGYYIIINKYSVSFVRTSQRMIVYRFKRSTSIFLSRVADMIIVRCNAIILGSFVGMKEVAYYDLANKVIHLGAYPIMILNQVIYPKIASEKNYLLMKRVIKYSLFVSGIITVCVLLSAGFIVDLLGRGIMEPSIPLIYCLSPLIIINSVIYLQGSPTLVAAGHYSEFNYSMWISFIVYFVGLVIIFCFGLIESIYSVIILQIATNMALLLARGYYIKKLKLFQQY